MVLAGIDPGQTNGIALWDPSRGKGDPLRLQLESHGFWSTYGLISGLFQPNEVAIYVEDPGLNKPTFGRNKLSKKTLDRKAQNVGMNKQTARLLTEGFKKAGYVVFECRPGSAKWSRKKLEQFSGYTGKSNQHERDAARLVVGRVAVNQMQFEKLLKEAS